MQVRTFLGIGIGVVCLWGCQERRQLAMEPRTNQTPVTPSSAAVQTPAAGKLEDAPASEQVAPKTPRPISRPQTAPNQDVRVAPQMTRPSRGQSVYPEQPKADETVTGKFTSAHQTIEIDAICSYADSIRCWDVNGNRNSNAEEKINQAISRSADQGYGSNQVSMRLGSKNRLLIIKNTRQQRMQHNMGEMMSYVHVQSAGFSSVMNHASLQLDQPQFDHQSTTHTNYEIRTVAESSSAKTTTLRLSRTDVAPESKEILLKKGEKTTVAGITVEIVSIKEGYPPHQRRISDQAKVWTVTFKHSNSASPNQANFNPIPLGQDGKPVQMVDENGNPISNEEMQKRMSQEHKPDSPRRSMLRSAQGGTVNDGKNLFLTLFADPKKLKGLQIRVSYTKNIDITGIPLDPR